VIIRNRTLSQYIGYDLYLKFSGLSLRRMSERLSCFIKRNQVSIWNWFKNTNHKGYLQEEKSIRVYHRWWNSNQGWFRIN